jgi:hypothetical protein
MFAMRISRIVAVAAILGAGAAHAQTPSGSYAQSCSNIQVSGNVLHAKCRTMAGGLVDTQLSLPCSGSIDNINGNLTCTGAPAAGVPPGSYLQSCGDARVQNSVLYANCRRANQTVAQASLALPCNGKIDNLNGVLSCTGGAAPAPAPGSAPAIVVRYAPFLKFDSGAGSYGYPMSADTYYQKVVLGKNVTQMQNTDAASIRPGNRIPLYYTIKYFGGQARIRYWIFYGYQAPCINVNGTGSHNGDWEDITVIVKTDGSGIAAVQFGQHGGRYMRIAGPRDAPCTAVGHCDGRHGFELSGTHPVAYIGRTAHGTFHDSSSGLAAAPGGSCTYYGDSRDGRGPSMETWGNLVSLDGNAESWIAADRKQNFPWGPDGVNTHPTVAAFPTASCTGDANQGLDNAGCFKSECLSGDDEVVGSCFKECKPGYSNVGLTCNKGKWPWEWSVYGRLDGGNRYGYGYGIPQTDAGLSRRRGDGGEWNLP